MKLSLDEDGNFLFDGKICTDDRIDDIREFVNNANKAFTLIKKFCSCLDPEDMTDNITNHFNHFSDLLEESGYNEGTANCIDNPPITATKYALNVADNYYQDGKVFWYDPQGNQHPL